MIGQFCRDLCGLIFLEIGLKSLLDFFESLLIIEKTLDFCGKIQRKNSFVILTVHHLHIDCVVEVSEEAVSGYHLVLGCLL